MSKKLISKFDFHKGKPVSKKTISEWHQKALKELRKKGITDYLQASGNSMVIGSKNVEDGIIEIFEITKGYKNFIYE